MTTQLIEKMEVPSEVKPYLIGAKRIMGGGQLLYKFDNGFGASVVRHEYSYGGKQGLFELAVLQFDGDEWDIHYYNDVACGDVRGYLNGDEVLDLLEQIKNF